MPARTLDIYGPDITEEEARRALAEALGCKPQDISISHAWTVVTPNPKVTGHEDTYLREHAGQLKAAVNRILLLCEEPR